MGNICASQPINEDVPTTMQGKSAQWTLVFSQKLDEFFVDADMQK
jgi:hypothetical protein